MGAFDEVGIFIELIGLFLFVRGLLKFDFVYFNLFRLANFKFQNNPQDTTIFFSCSSLSTGNHTCQCSWWLYKWNAY